MSLGAGPLGWTANSCLSKLLVSLHVSVLAPRRGDPFGRGFAGALDDGPQDATASSACIATVAAAEKDGEPAQVPWRDTLAVYSASQPDGDQLMLVCRGH